jgi:hypothetical protein
MVMAATISGQEMVNDKWTGRVSSLTVACVWDQSSRISSFKGSALRILSSTVEMINVECDSYR